MLLFALACTNSDDSTPSDSVPTVEGGEVVTLTTRDDVTIVADHWGASSGDRPAVVLVHMNPSGAWQRTDWPASFVQLLVDEDWAVIRPDRRGAGDSGGVAEDAYNTVKGSYDIEACVEHLQVAGFSELVIVSASNGTTSTWDYMGGAETEGWPQVTTAALISVVGTTTANTDMDAIPELPIWFGYPAFEADNNTRFEDANPGGWVFQEYDPGEHGTKLFADTPALETDITDWLKSQLP
ncbi:MAG: alpha/beta hydrolase [Proteobacteria bacterium]|nr:alpha/beta hydrolase [Pseudomonadota bacterium]MCP4917815.1 alpha/beta hydrolase [Pseudomonadota bacterium]